MTHDKWVGDKEKQDKNMLYMNVGFDNFLPE